MQSGNCGKPHVKFHHLSNMKGGSQSLKDKILNTHPQYAIDRCICDKCKSNLYKEMKDGKPIKDAACSNTGSVIADKPLCFFSGVDRCNEPIYTRYVLQDAVAFRKTFSIDSEMIILEKIPLCKVRYNVVYASETKRECAACKASLRRKDRKKVHSCSGLNIESANFKINAVYPNAQLTKDSDICSKCYNIVTHKKPTSLTDVIAYLQYDCEDDVDSARGQDSILNRALNDTSRKLCDIFEKNGAILFVEVCEMFNAQVGKLARAAGCEISKKEGVRGREWILGGLQRIFGSLISVNSSSATKESKMLLYKHSDPVKVLHKLLYRNRVKQQLILDETNTDEQEDIVTVDEQNTTLLCAAVDINRRLREQANKITHHFKEQQNVLDMDKLNFDHILMKLDPKVWNMFSLLTMNTEEARMIKHHNFSWEIPLRLGEKDSNYRQIQFMRRMLLIFTSQFIMNNNHQYPFHVSNANVLKRLSNSSKLLKIK